MRRGQGFGVELVLAERALAADVGAHDGLGAVVEQLARDAAEVPERGALAGPEGHQILRARERAERVAGVAEDHVEAVERQLDPRARADRLLV
jgi:hypothetical protein